MKPYEYIKTSEERVSKVFGYPVYSIKFTEFSRNQCFLNGFVSTCKKTNPDNMYIEKDIKILGLSLFKRIEDDDVRRLYFNGKCFYRKSLKEDFAKLCFKRAKKKYDKVYILNANSGETYLFLTYVLKALMSKNKNQSILLVAKNKYHIDLIKMISPDVDYVFISRKIVNNIQWATCTIDGCLFQMIFELLYFKSVEDGIKNDKSGSKHYFKYILEKLNISENELEYSKIQIPKESEKSLKRKVKKIKLNLDKFVFISPEAKSCINVDVAFWIELIKNIRAKGYDVFVNIAEKNIEIPDNECDYKSCFLTFSEAFSLASKAKRIISLRSGFTEVLLQTNVPIDILYTGYKDRPYFGTLTTDEVMSGYAVSKLPNSNEFKIIEYKAEESDLTNISASIIQKL